ncbi:NETI motif-containing protein [Peribacillus sp. SCS-37]|uniref:NETI motif-containing protein n=1 Tax=Paraperibacillus esterisolvens TaxID=3115296 RepID=UPI003906908A
MAKGKKATYEVGPGETIDECLARIKADGYMPVRRTEKPVFKEVNQSGKVEYEPAGRQIVFEAREMQ